MNMEQDLTNALQEQVQDAVRRRQGVKIKGGNSKEFLARGVRDDLIPLEISGHRGIVNYDPSELVLTARTGTPLSELEDVLAQAGQMLPFEPPHFGAGATLGGTVACNLSGPRRAYAGAARDFVLGTRIINGKGEVLRFGGEVMKNVAGYDVSRLMAGAMGTLGVVLEVSLKVLPRPAASATIVHSCDPDQALKEMNIWAGRPYPISATCYVDGRLYVRLEGTMSSVDSAAGQLGGELLTDADKFWDGVREQRHDFFNNEQTLWRLSVKPTASLFDKSVPWMLEWGGAQRWTTGVVGAAKIREYAAGWGGHAVQFRHADPDVEVFHPLTPGLKAIHERLKLAFDPERIFNPDRYYP